VSVLVGVGPRKLGGGADGSPRFAMDFKQVCAMRAEASGDHEAILGRFSVFSRVDHKR
jgi:hypothetical protein